MHKRIKRHLDELLQIPGDWRRRISSKREQGLATWAGSTPLQRFSTALLTAAVVVSLAIVVIGEGGDVGSDITVSADEGPQAAAENEGDVEDAATSTPSPDVIAPVLDAAAPVPDSVADPIVEPAPLIVPSLISDVEPRATEKPKTKVAGKSVSRSTTTTTPRRVVAPNRNFSLLFAVPSPAPTAAPSPAPTPTRPPSSSPAPTPVTVPPLFPTTTRPVTTTTQPVTVPPTTRPVVTVPPTTAAPTTAAPTTAAPTTAAPTTAAPTTSAPTTAAPTTAAPTTAAPPTTEAPPDGE